MNINKNSVIYIQDCERIVRRYLQSDNFQVLHYETRPFSGSVHGFMGDHLQIQIKVHTEGKDEEVSCFAKRFPFHHELQSRYALSVKAFTQEILTYEVLFEEFKKHKGFRSDIAPKYYFGKDNNILVFEDLSKKGFVAPQHPNALSLDHIKLTLQVLAKFHAGSIGYQETKSKLLGQKYKLMDEYSEYIQEPLFRRDETFLGYGWFKGRLSALKAAIDLLPTSKEITRDVFKEELSALAEKCFEILKPSDSHYHTLCHGDMWAKNVMFRYENGVPAECKLIDFQLQRFCPPAHDVLHFIYLTTNTATRQHHLHKLLRYYYECLREELHSGNLDLDDIIPYEDFDKSVHYLLPQIKLQTAYYYSFQGPSPDFHKKLVNNLTDFKNFVFKDGAPFLIELFKTDENYKMLMAETIEELKDFIIHTRVTLEDCFKITESKLKTTQYQLLSRSIDPLGRIGGFLGDHYKLQINVCINDNQEKLNFFAKSVPENKTRSEMAIEGRAFLKESFFFQKLIPLIRGVCEEEMVEYIVPCHLIRLNEVLILDDIECLQFYSANPQVPFDVDELKIILKKLATYHASNIIVEENISKEMSKAFRLGSHFANEVEENFFPTNMQNPSSESIKIGIKAVDHQIDLFPDPNSKISQEDFKKKAKRAFEVLYELVKPSQKYRNVVCHGDLRASNVMMKYNNKKPIDCRIIDYQILRYCPPAHDLLCLLYLTTNRKVRVQYMQQMIDFYYEMFTGVLNKHDCDVNKIYPRQHFMESCEYMTPQAVCQTVLYYHFTMTKSDLLSKYTGSEESTRKIFLEDRRDFISDMCEKDVIYRDRMGESIQDLREMCLKYF